eukprot:2030952-Pyramimonas_sp.AAC.1
MAICRLRLPRVYRSYAVIVARLPYVFCRMCVTLAVFFAVSANVGKRRRRCPNRRSPKSAARLVSAP